MSLEGKKMEFNFEGKISLEELLGNQKKSRFFQSLVYGENYFFYGNNREGLVDLLKQGFRNKIDLVYIDPPFGTSNTFRDTSKSGSAISTEISSEIAYTDILIEDDFLAFIWQRFLLLYQLLSDKGTLYVHIDIKYSSYFKIMLDEIFGKPNFLNEIARIKSNPKNFDRKAYGNEHDTILVYAKRQGKNIWNDIRVPLNKTEEKDKFPKKDNRGSYTTVPVHAPGTTQQGVTSQKWRDMFPPVGRHWRTSPDELEKLDKEGLIEWSSTGNPRIKKYLFEHKGKKRQDVWKDFKDPQRSIYPTEKNNEMLKQIILQSSNKESYVLDCFAGSGGTLASAYKLNRKYIGMDSSKLSLSIIKKRLPDTKIMGSISRINSINYRDILQPEQLVLFEKSPIYKLKKSV